MKPMKLLAVAAVLFIAAGLAPAHASYTFSGSGITGNFTGQAGEPFSFDFDGGSPQHNWGSPGVGAGTTPYLETLPAYALSLNFSDALIDPASLATGNLFGCAGGSSGGTTMCGNGVHWNASLTGTNSILFSAINPTDFLSNGQNFFANVFFTNSSGLAFTGTWLTEFVPPTATPLPAALPLFLSGIGGLGLLGLRKKRRQA